MRECVIADIMAFIIDAANQVRMAHGAPADNEERRFHTFFMQDIEYSRGDAIVRPVVERQGDAIGRPRSPARDAMGRGQLFHPLPDNEGRSLVQVECAPPWTLLGFHRKRIARSLRRNAEAGLRTAQLSKDPSVGAPALSEGRPCAWILEAQSPERQRGRACSKGSSRLIEYAHAIEKPYVVPATFPIEIGKARVEGLLVESEFPIPPPPPNSRLPGPKSAAAARTGPSHTQRSRSQ